VINDKGYWLDHAEEIMATEKAFCDRGGKWIVYVPKMQIIV
jgi:hypothetical protein